MRRTICGLFTCIATAALFAARANAADEVTVVITGTGSGRPATILFDAGEAINAANGLPTIETTDTRVNVYSTGSLAAIGRITFTASAGSRGDLEVFLGIGAFPTSPVLLTERGTHWGGIAALPSALVSKVNLAGAITGNLTGSVSVDRIFRLEIGDEVQGAIEASGTGNAIRRINFGSSTSDGTITATNGDIVTLLSTLTTGSIQGAIAAPNGKIGNIEALGDISIVANPGISALTGIDSVSAAYVAANIDAAAGASIGTMNAFKTTGSFSGSLHASAIGFVGQTDEENALVVDIGSLRDREESPASPSSIEIDGDLYGGISISPYYAEESITIDSIVVHGNMTVGTVVIGASVSLWQVGSEEAGGDLAMGGFGTMTVTGGIGELTVKGAIRPIETDPPMCDVYSFTTPYIFSLSAGSLSGGWWSGPLGGTPPFLTPGNIFIDTCQVGGDFSPDQIMAEGISTMDVGGSIGNACIPDLLFVKSFAAHARIRVGQSIESDKYLRFKNLFKGQVIVNAANASGDWQGVVRANDITLDGPYYSATSASLGGGAVGLVPYAINELDSEPCACLNADTLPLRTWPDSTERETFVIRSYGPVHLRSGTADEAFTVERLDTTIASPSPVDVTDDYDFLVQPYVGSVQQKREVWVSRKLVDDEPQAFDLNFIYKVGVRRNGSGQTLLVSDETFASSYATAPDVQESITGVLHSWPYTVQVQRDLVRPIDCPCKADFDASGGTPDGTDLSDFFDMWVLGDASADVDCSGGTPDTNDIGLYFLEWLQGGCYEICD